MIRSMTGFGHGEVSNDKNQKVTVEMKSVNHRYCDISLKLPKKLAMFEANIRNIMKEYASRGKIDIYVSYEDLSETAVSLHYNQAMAEEYMQVFKKMQEDFNIETKITAEALAKYPEVVTIEEVQQDEEVWWELLEAALRQAAEKFVETRTIEGANLKRDLLGKLDQMAADVAFIEERSPQIIAEYRSKLEEKVNAIEIELENGQKVLLSGKIDRVDILKNPDGTYVRIIDYKSSIKNIDLNQVISGLQLQLITYLNETCRVEDFIPAGMLYFKLSDPTISVDKNMSVEEIENKIRQEFKMNGLILADVNIIKKMDNNIENEPKGISKIIPAGIKTDGEINQRSTNAISKQQFENLQKYANKIIKQISESILSGNIDVKPSYNVRTKNTPCTYCKYRAICRFDENNPCNKYNYISNLNKESAMEVIKNESN
mgnify:CR=1 FL=1